MSEDQAQGLREYVKQTMAPNARVNISTGAFLHTVEPNWYLRVGVKDGQVVQVDWSNSLYSGALSTPPTVEQVKQWLEDAVKFLEGKP